MEELPYLNMNFTLEYEGKGIPLKSVKSISQEPEQEYIQEGGLNGYVHVRPKPASRPYVLQIERYITSEYGNLPKLSPGTVLKAPLFLMAGHYPGNPLRLQFKFTGCTVTGRSYGDLNASRAEAFTETISISYQEMELNLLK